jgi:hypothetical protein
VTNTPAYRTYSFYNIGTNSARVSVISSQGCPCRTPKYHPLLKMPAWDNHSSLYVGAGILKGKYHCTVDLLFDWFGISCMTTDNFCFYLQKRPIQTSQTGGQWYSGTSPFSIPWSEASVMKKKKFFKTESYCR